MHPCTVCVTSRSLIDAAVVELNIELQRKREREKSFPRGYPWLSLPLSFSLSEISSFSQPNVHVLIIRLLINNSKVTGVFLKISWQLNNGFFWPFSALCVCMYVRERERETAAERDRLVSLLMRCKIWGIKWTFLCTSYISFLLTRSDCTVCVFEDDAAANHHHYNPDLFLKPIYLSRF